MHSLLLLGKNLSIILNSNGEWALLSSFWWPLTPGILFLAKAGKGLVGCFGFRFPSLLLLPFLQSALHDCLSRARLLSASLSDAPVTGPWRHQPVRLVTQNWHRSQVLASGKLSPFLLQPIFHARLV